MYEHKDVWERKLPTGAQLDEFAKDGWELFYIIPIPSTVGDRTLYAIYLRRLIVKQ